MCAVKINLHELLLENRKEAVDEKHSSFGERIAWKLWKKAMLNRKLMNAANGKTKSLVVNGLAKDWKKHRSNLQFPQQSFNQQWQQQKKNLINLPCDRL